VKWDQLAIVVGARIRRLRKNADLTIEALAERAGVGAVYLGAVERGIENPSLKILTGVAEALGVSVAQLVDVDADLAPRSAKKELLGRLAKGSREDGKLLLRLLAAIRERA
jgi:transcriptional regulator with XRE-family HTH domain